MKKLLLLSIFSTLTFSCSEYSDDGTPSDGNIVITNPDGTKKVKRMKQTVIAESSMGGIIPGQDMSLVMTSEILSEFSQENYSYTTNIASSTEFSGLGDMGGNGQDIDTNFTDTITNTVNADGLVTEINQTTQAQGVSSVSRSTFTYDNNRLTSFSSYENESLVGSATLVYNTDNVIITREYTNSQIGTETLTLNLDGNTITGGSVENSNTNNNITFDIVRNGVNVTQINLSSNSSSSTANYSYDSAVNFMNNLAPEMNETRMAGEVVSFINVSYQPQDIGGQLDLHNVEAGLRAITNLAENNLTNVTINGETVFSRTFGYDNDNYPISFSDTSTTGDIFDFSSMLEGMRDTMIEQFTAFGMSEDEAIAQADMMIENFGDLDTNATVDNSGTIEYFE